MKLIFALLLISLIACKKEIITPIGQSSVKPHVLRTAVLVPKKPAGVKVNGGATSARRPIGPKG